MEYKRPDVGLKIYREALARFAKFSILRLGVYTQYAHENSNQSLIKRFVYSEIFNIFMTNIYSIKSTSHVSQFTNIYPMEKQIQFLNDKHKYNNLGANIIFIKDS